MVVHVNKMACPWVKKLDFRHMNLWIMSHLSKGDLDHRGQSNIICWHVCNPRSVMWWP
jgi:hypothetical protein